jgi:hypothetical protein
VERGTLCMKKWCVVVVVVVADVMAEIIHFGANCVVVLFK